VLLVVSDSSVIIDLAKVRLIEGALRLPYDFLIPDVMFADELIDLGSYRRASLRKFGLRIGELDGDGVGLAFQYVTEYHHLSENDCFALALAKIQAATLLAGDAKLRQAAIAESVDVHGLLWLCDRMKEHGTVTRKVLYDALVSLAKDPLVRLPRAELKKRISGLTS